MKLTKPASLWPVIIIIVLALIFFWKILLTNLILSGVDVFLYFYPYRAYAAEALRQGRLPLWNPHLFMGVPFMANSQVGLFYPFNSLLVWLDTPKQISWSIGLHIMLAGIWMLAFSRAGLKLQWTSATIAAISFAFAGYLGAQVEHINQLQAAAWLPLLFLLADLGLHHARRWLWHLLLGLVLALVLLAGHAQTAFISLSGVGLYCLWQALFENPFDLNIANGRLFSIIKHYTLAVIGHLWPLAMAIILAVGLAAVQLLPTAELSGLSIRSGGLTFREAVSFSLRPTNLHYSLLPPLGLDLTQVFGEAFGEWIVYLGISGLVLAGLGALMSIWQPVARRFVFLSLAGLTLSFGVFTGPLYVVLYQIVPGFGLFRVPARWLLLYAFAMAVLAACGFEAITPAYAAASRRHLAATGRWLTGGPWWRLLFPFLPLLGLLALIIWKTPPISTLLIWTVLFAVSLVLIAAALYQPHRSRLNQIARPALAGLLVLELFWAGQSLNYNQATAPQAYHSLRNAPAFLLAADPPRPSMPPGRFLSLSGITYDPGDLAELQAIFGPYLSEQALYNLIVASKEKEVLFFNLPLLYGLHSVDGYDGGILPLASFVTLQKLFLPEDNLSIDGRLREKLQFVPANHLLSLLNTRWIITDKQFDAWIDGIFYDLQFPARLGPNEAVATTDMPSFTATAWGLVSHLEGATHLSADTPVAQITVSFADGSSNLFTLTAGRDSAEGIHTAEVAHPQARIGVTWPYEQAGVDYVTVKALTSTKQVSQIVIKSLLHEGEFVLRGLSLIHQPTATSRSVMISTDGDYRQVHSGDVKVYENLAVLPRAFIVHQATTVTSAEAAIELLKDPDFDNKSGVVFVGAAEEQQTVGQPSPEDRVTVQAYTPERVVLETTLASPGWLVLTDTNYPGWQATINGQPASISTANILFRAVALPAGQHLVEFKFAPQSFKAGAWISGVVLVSLIAGLIWVYRRKL